MFFMIRSKGTQFGNKPGSFSGFFVSLISLDYDSPLWFCDQKVRTIFILPCHVFPTTNPAWGHMVQDEDRIKAIDGGSTLTLLGEEESPPTGF